VDPVYGARMALRMVVSVVFGLGWIASHAGDAHALTVLNKDDSGAGSLRAAVAAANGPSGAGSVITFDPAVRGTITLSTPLLTLVHPVTIQGPGADLLTIAGAAGAPVFAFNTGDRVHPSSISGLVISGGSNPGNHGGGIFVAADTGLAVLNCVITGNAADQGSGIYSEGASLLIKQTAIAGNTGLGALYAATTSAVTVFESTIGNNQGTAIVFNPPSDQVLAIEATTVSGNDGGSGIGGLQLQAGEATLTNTTFSGNAGAVGADFWTSTAGVTLTLTSVTAVSDTSPSLVVEANTTARLRNTLLAGPGARCEGPPVSLGHNLTTDASCDLADASDKPGVGDARLGPLADNGGPTQTHALLAGSPAIDAGDGALDPDPNNPGIDQRGERRTQFAGVDIGALEVTEPVITQQPTAQGVTAGHALTLVVVAANQNSATPLGYQWRKDGVAIAGATSATFAKVAAVGDAGSYDVLVQNDGGGLASDAVAVTVDPAPAPPEPPAVAHGGGCSSAGGAGASGLLALLVAAALGIRGAGRPTGERRERRAAQNDRRYSSGI